PVNSIVQQSSTGHATNIIGGLAVGMESTVLPILVLAAGIVFSYFFAGLYGVAIAAAGMMATTAMQLAIDAFGPIADNAGGIAEMSGLPKEVRERTDNLDAVGNTTAASGKGFAIASAALTSLALFAAFVGISGISSIDIYKAPVLAGLFVGAMIPFIFSALCISAVGRAAMAMVHEVRRQFKENPGIMDYTVKPEYEKCVAISTEASLKEMMLPGAIALVVPVAVGFGFGPEVLGGLIAGVTVSGVLMGIFQSNAGGAWDNAKKSFEKGVEINGKMEYKGSEAHKASITGDTVGDPFKDTSGPSMNILIKLMSIVSLVIAPHIAVTTTPVVPSLGIPESHINMPSETITLEDGTYQVIASETNMEWIGKKLYKNHFGNVNVSKGQYIIENGKITSGNFTIDMTSISNADLVDAESNQKLIGHLKSDDFFSVNNFPNAEFKIKNVGHINDGYAVIKGDLNIKGISNEVSFPALISKDGNNIIAIADFKIDRSKWDVKYDSKSFFSDLGDKFILDDIQFKLKLVVGK
nr:sodium/proton-translocating pyrophosphatase [Bacteroidota bacterium]